MILDVEYIVVVHTKVPWDGEALTSEAFGEREKLRLKSYLVALGEVISKAAEKEARVHSSDAFYHAHVDHPVIYTAKESK